MSFNAIKYYGFYKSLSRIMAHNSVNLRQILLLRGYIHPDEQPVVFMPYMLCHFAAY